jgi:ABC-type molybdate transport system permease subunit
LTNGILLITLGLVFAISGIKINYRISKYFKEFYFENKSMLCLATMGLSIPLIVRGTLDILREFDNDLEEFTEELYPATFNILFYIICDLLPLFFQLSSLIFGYIRRKHDK